MTGGSSDDNYEPNNNRTAACDLTLHERVWLHLINGYGIQADDDYYEIYVNSDIIHILCTFTDAQGDIDIALLNSAGNLVDYSESTTDNEEIIFDASSLGHGTYYIVVYFDDAGNQYDLWWDDKPLEDPAGINQHCWSLYE